MHVVVYGKERVRLGFASAHLAVCNRAMRWLREVADATSVVKMDELRQMGDRDRTWARRVSFLAD